jgi:hypothetical protein
VKFEEAAVDALNHGFCSFWDSFLLYYYIYIIEKKYLYMGHIYIYIYNCTDGALKMMGL